MSPSPRPANTMHANIEVVEVAVASKIQDTMKGKEDKIMALFLPRASAKSPPIKEVDVDDNAQDVPVRVNKLTMSVSINFQHTQPRSIF